MTTHALSADPTHSVWDRALEPRLRIHSGDEVEFGSTQSINCARCDLDICAACDLDPALLG